MLKNKTNGLGAVSMSLLFVGMGATAFANDIGTGGNQGHLPSVGSFIAKPPATCESDNGRQKSTEVVQKQAYNNNLPGKKVFLKPSKRTSSSVTYNVNRSRLRPGESLYFRVPEDLSGRAIQFAKVVHRQIPGLEKGYDHSIKRDKIPGLTTFSVYTESVDKKGEWRVWGGPSTDGRGGKFADLDYWEHDNLYEWLDKCHANFQTGNHSCQPIQPKAFRLHSSGQDSVWIDKVTLKVVPPKADFFDSKVFTPKTQFGNQQDGSGYHFGGGQKNKGRFPQALALGGGSFDQSRLPKGWRLQGDTLVIPLKPGKTLSSVEVLGGDSRPDGVRNSDGGWGSKGRARLQVAIGDDFSKTTLLDNENVPPEGILTAFAKKCSGKIKQGQNLYIRSNRGITYLMALRVGYKK